MEKTIKVTGKGKVSLKPDLIRIKIDIEGIEKDYGDMLTRSSMAVAEVKTAIAKLGFERTDIKTLHYDTQIVYESYQKEDRSWDRHFVGYKYTHNLKFEFPLDNEMLGKVLYAIAHCNTTPEFNIEYSVSDPEAAKDELLTNAIADSKHKAELLVEASGLHLDALQSINYSWDEVEFVARPFSRLCNEYDAEYDCGEGIVSNPSRYDMDVEPDNIDVSDTVTVMWSMR